MAVPKLYPIQSDQDLSFDATREAEFAAAEDELRTVPKSARIRIHAETFLPERIRGITMDVVAAVYEDAYGYLFDYDRVLATFGFTRLDFPRRLMGPFLIELSKHLHPGRRPGFLRSACEALHQLESTPRVFA
jgi:hypothetical protein